jgi:hypothetical protein
MNSFSENNLRSISALLTVLPDGVYTQPCSQLSGATIGQHVRHTLELYQCLLSGYESGLIAYDKRKRDKTIETELSTSEVVIDSICAELDKPDKVLQVVYEIEGREISLQSNYQRELMYNLEHAIHHMALIKVAVISLTDIVLPIGFGVAPSTITFRAQCVQ